MKYKQLPLERELAGNKDAPQIVGGLIVETMRTRGFQLVTGILRNLERAYYNAVVTGDKPERAVGALQCIESIRRSLLALLPVEQRPSVDWFDEADEGFLVDTEASQDPDN